MQVALPLIMLIGQLERYLMINKQSMVLPCQWFFILLAHSSDFFQISFFLVRKISIFDL